MKATFTSRVHPRRRVTRAGAGFLVQYAALGAALGVAPIAAAQCQPTWSCPIGTSFVNPFALTAFDEDGPGPLPECLYAGGVFAEIGGVSAHKIARYDGWRWSALGSGIPEQFAFVYALEGRAQAQKGYPAGLYLGGNFFAIGTLQTRSLGRWSDHEWRPLDGWAPTQSNGANIRSLRAFADPGQTASPSQLMVAGVYELATNPAVTGIGSWNGTAWSSLGTGIYPAGVNATAVYDDDGSGPRPAGLYVIGYLQTAGGAPANGIARWDGKNWEPLGSGLNAGPNLALCVFDEDGPGPQREYLFVGGGFNHAGGIPMTGLARWDGQQWSAVPGWWGGGVQAMAVFDDDGPGPNKPALFVGGGIIQVAGMPASALVKWDGQNWNTLQGGVTGFPVQSEVKSLGVYDEDGAGPNPGGLYVGGYFFFTGTGIPAKGLARWGCPLPPECYANCTRDFDPITGAHVLSVADFGCFQTKYVLGDLFSADCNADGALTVADFGCFQGKYVLGCP